MVSIKQQVLSIGHVPAIVPLEYTPSSVERCHYIPHCVQLEGHPTSEFGVKYFKDPCSLQKWWQEPLCFRLTHRNKSTTP